MDNIAYHLLSKFVTFMALFASGILGYNVASEIDNSVLNVFISVIILFCVAIHAIELIATASGD